MSSVDSVDIEYTNSGVEEMENKEQPETKVEEETREQPKVRETREIEVPKTATQIKKYKTKMNKYYFDNLWFDPVSKTFYNTKNKNNIRTITNKNKNIITARNTDNKTIRISKRSFQKYYNNKMRKHNENWEDIKLI